MAWSWAEVVAGPGAGGEDWVDVPQAASAVVRSSAAAGTVSWQLRERLRFALVNRMLAASRDSVGLIRNNALRVLSDIALYYRARATTANTHVRMAKE